MIRKLASKLNKKVMMRLSPSRFNHRVPVTITIEPDRITGSLTTRQSGLSVKGETKDMSESGLAFVVPCIRLREHYLAGEGKLLTAQLDLPNGKISVQIVGQRYEQIDIHSSNGSYLIGAKIVHIGAVEREIYLEFLRYGDTLRPGKTGNLALGVTKT
jgi:hypothetical protein